MKRRISVSIFSEDFGAVGHVDGRLDFPVEPMVGDTVSFMVSPSNVPLDAALGFDGLLKVEYRVLVPGSEEQEVSLMLQEMNFAEKDNALRVMDLLESGFGLDAHRY